MRTGGSMVSSCSPPCIRQCNAAISNHSSGSTLFLSFAHFIKSAISSVGRVLGYQRLRWIFWVPRRFHRCWKAEKSQACPVNWAKRNYTGFESCIALHYKSFVGPGHIHLMTRTRYTSPSYPRPLIKTVRCPTNFSELPRRQGQAQPSFYKIETSDIISATICHLTNRIQILGEVST